MYGEIIKNLRLSYNLSQVQLANELNEIGRAHV